VQGVILGSTMTANRKFVEKKNGAFAAHEITGYLR
jgi:hypothetical protein